MLRSFSDSSEDRTNIHKNARLTRLVEEMAVAVEDKQLAAKSKLQHWHQYYVRPRRYSGALNEGPTKRD